MNDREMRELLQEIIEDVDHGRVQVQRPRAVKTAGTVLAAAAALGLGVGMAACSGPAKRDVQDPGDNRPQTSQVDAGTKAASSDAATGDDPVARPKPPDSMKPDAPVPAYGVPVTRPRPRKPMDQGATPDYGVP